MSFIRYIFSKKGGKQVLRIALVYIVVAVVLWAYLWWYTDHGQYVSVPNLQGMTVEAAAQSLEERDLKYAVVDSIFNEDEVGGVIWDQSPSAESQVKDGRQVFLSVYCKLPPQEKISIEQGEYAPVALVKLKNKGLKAKVIYEPNNNMVGSVIKVRWKGKTVKPGDLIPRGSEVQVYVGESMNEKVVVPNLFGMRLDSALAVLEQHNLMPGNINSETILATAQDSAASHVCRQDPSYDPEMRVSPGRLVDLYISKEPCGGDTTKTTSDQDQNP